MKKQFYRISSIVLSLVFSFVLIQPTFAFVSTEVSNSRISIVHGTDELSTKAYPMCTEFKDIKESYDGDYAMTLSISSQTVYVPVGRLDIDLLDNTDFSNAMSQESIPLEVKERLQDQRNQAIELGYDSFSVTYFSPVLIQSSNSSPTTTYYSYNGHQMRNDQLYSTDMDTGYTYIAQGKTVKEIASETIDIFIRDLVTSAIAEQFPIISNGLSLIEYFNQYFPTYVTGHTNDFLQIRLVYDVTDQWTYMQDYDGRWKLGLISQNVHIDSAHSLQYYYNATLRDGRSLESHRYPNIDLPTENFADPWAAAYQWSVQTKREEFTWKVGNVVFEF